jgi:hypothetical protein
MAAALGLVIVAGLTGCQRAPLAAGRPPGPDGGATAGDAGPGAADALADRGAVDHADDASAPGTDVPSPPPADGSAVDGTPLAITCGEPETVASGPELGGSVDSMALGDTAVFFTGQVAGDLGAAQVPKEGGAVIAQRGGNSQGIQSSIVVAGEFAYWAYYPAPGFGGVLYRMTLSGDPPDLVRFDHFQPKLVAVTSTGQIALAGRLDDTGQFGLLYLPGFDSSVQTVQTVAPASAPYAVGLATDDERLFALIYVPPGGTTTRVVSFDLQALDRPAVDLAALDGEAAPMAQAAGHLYVVVHHGISEHPLDALVAVGKQDGQVTTLSPSAGTGLAVRSLAVDERYLYVSATSPVEGMLMRISLDGTGPLELLAREHVPTAIAVDATHLYWGTADVGYTSYGVAIRRLALATCR